MPRRPFTSPRRRSPSLSHPRRASRLPTPPQPGVTSEAAEALRLPQPGLASETRREPGELRGCAGATLHSLLLLLPHPSDPRGRRLRRPALRRLSCCSPGQVWQPRVAYIGAPVSRPPHPSARAALCRWTPPPSGAPGRAAAGLGPGGVCSRPSCSGKSVTRGRVLPAIARTAGHQVGPVGRREPIPRRPPPRPCGTLLIANCNNNCMCDLEQVISITRKGPRALCGIAS